MQIPSQLVAGGSVRPGSAPVPEHSTGAVRGAMLGAVEDLQSTFPDIGWVEAGVLIDSIFDQLSHALVDLCEPSYPRAPRQVHRPPTLAPVPAAGEGVAQADHASCRAGAAALRRAARVFSARQWVKHQQLAEELGELLDHVAERTRAQRMLPSDKAVVLRRLHQLHRRLAALA